MRVLVCSDIHANLEALEAVLKDAGKVDAVWCLGDVVGYGPDPNACVERVRRLPNCICLAGNHDWAALGKLDIEHFNTEARKAILWTREQLTSASRQFLEGCPERYGPVASFYTLTHGSPRYPIWEYVLDVGTARANFDHFETPICFVGHSHVPGIFALLDDRVHHVVVPEDQPLELSKGRFIVNPGGVGQPRDGDPRASYVLLDAEDRTITYRRVEYPVEVTQKKMQQAGLPPRIIARLAYGW